eukprot:8884811-Ditylum_brightwellii.AAC.1
MVPGPLVTTVKKQENLTPVLSYAVPHTDLNSRADQMMMSTHDLYDPQKLKNNWWPLFVQVSDKMDCYTENQTKKEKKKKVFTPICMLWYNVAQYSPSWSTMVNHLKIRYRMIRDSIIEVAWGVTCHVSQRMNEPRAAATSPCLKRAQNIGTEVALYTS